MASIDVTVRGAGIFGLACAWEMARWGARVQVVDPGGPGAGASGGVLGALAPHTPDPWNAKKQFQLDALLAAPAFWAGVEAASGLSVGFSRLGRLQPIADAAALALAHARAEAAARNWAGEVWEVVRGGDLERSGLSSAADPLPDPPPGRGRGGASSFAPAFGVGGFPSPLRAGQSHVPYPLTPSLSPEGRGGRQNDQKGRLAEDRATSQRLPSPAQAGGAPPSPLGGEGWGEGAPSSAIAFPWQGEGQGGGLSHRFEPASPTGWLIRDSLSARIAPRRAIAALVEALRRADVAIVPDAPGSGAVLWATGVAGLADLSAAFGREVGGSAPGFAALLDHDAREVPQVFADGIHIVPHADGTTAVGSADSAESLEAMIATARRLVPALADAPVIERWRGERPRARTRAPMLGPWPGRPGHFVANGGFRIGLGLAPAVAATMAALILSGSDRIPPGFRPEASL